jgi:hypothetical protein
MPQLETLLREVTSTARAAPLRCIGLFTAASNITGMAAGVLAMHCKWLIRS